MVAAPAPFRIPKLAGQESPKMFRAEFILHRVIGTHPRYRPMDEECDETAAKEIGFVAGVSADEDENKEIRRIFWPDSDFVYWLVEPLSNRDYEKLMEEQHIKVVTVVDDYSSGETSQPPPVPPVSGFVAYNPEKYDYPERFGVGREWEQSIPRPKRKKQFPGWFQPYEGQKCFNINLGHVGYELICLQREPSKENMAFLHGRRMSFSYKFAINFHTITCNC
jgi:hypothetical protein